MQSLWLLIKIIFFSVITKIEIPHAKYKLDKKNAAFFRRLCLFSLQNVVQLRLHLNGHWQVLTPLHSDRPMTSWEFYSLMTISITFLSWRRTRWRVTHCAISDRERKMRFIAVEWRSAAASIFYIFVYMIEMQIRRCDKMFTQIYRKKRRKRKKKNETKSRRCCHQSSI